MSKFIVLTCTLLFWGFYEMSGGADFVPLERKIPVAKAPIQEDIVEPFVAETIIATAVEVTPENERENPLGYEIIPAPEAVIETVAFVTETEPQEAVVIEDAPLLPIRTVAGDRVNMRDGPSTDYVVLDTLSRGTEAEVLAVNGDGWAQVRLLGSGQIGWMAERLLSEG